MKDEKKTKAQLIEELAELRQRTDELEGRESQRNSEDIQQLEQRNRELEEKEHLLTAFHQMGKMTLSALSQDQILDNLAEQIIKAGILRSLMIALVHEEAQQVEVVRNYVCITDDEVKPEESIQISDRVVPMEEGRLVITDLRITGTVYDLNEDNITAEVARSGQMQVISGWSVKFDDKAGDPEDREGKVAYFIPVKQGDRVVAVLATGSTIDEKEETLKRIGIMRFLLDQFAIALEHARLYENVQREIAERKRTEKALRQEYSLHEAEAAIRIRIAEMDQSQQLCHVVQEISVQLQKVGVIFESCAIQIVNSEGTDFIAVGKNVQEYLHDRVPAFMTTGLPDASRSNAEEYPWVIEVWKTEKARYNPCTALGSWSDISLIDVPFSHGTLAINSGQSHAFREGDIEILQRFAHVLSDGFQRFLDIIDRKQAEEALRESEEQFRSLAESSTDLIMRYDRQFRHIYANEACLRVSGKTKEEYIGKTHRELDLDPTLCGLWEKKIQAVFDTGKPQLEIFEWKGTEGEVVLDWRVMPEFSEDGSVQSVLGVARDISEQKRMEEEIRRVHNLESLGLLAGGIAHDFNNILTGVTGNLALLLRFLDKDSEEYEIASDAQQAASKTRGLTQQLMTFAKGGTPIKETASIEELIRETTGLSLRGSNTKPEYHFSGDLSSVDMDTGQIGQVIQNLVINADQAMPNGGTLKILADNVEISEEAPIPLEPGIYVKISVEDQGVGIPESILSQVFDPYFSTKETGHGLGLSITYSIIQRHDGHITVTSQQNIGTTFEFYLPTSEKQTITVTETEQELARGIGRILLMDDEQTIHGMVSRTLEMLGYEVESVFDGNEAIKEYKAALGTDRSFAVVIMDLTIPGGMGGMEAVGKLHEIDPQARVLVSSGYANDPVMANYEKYGFAGRLSKPVDVQRLADVVKSVLESEE